MLTIQVIFKDKTIKEKDITRYGVENNILFIEKTIYHSRGKHTEYINKFYPLYNILWYEIYDEK